MKILQILAASLFAFTLSAGADTFGSGSNVFEIDFVTIGNPGNSDDAGAGGGVYSTPYGGVAYTFRMGTYEVSQDMVTKATNLGMSNVTAGDWAGDRPATSLTWYEAAAFVNWLNISTGHQAAYNLTFNGSWSMSLWDSEVAWQLGGENLYRHEDAFYFLPSEDEWYKAAYHKNDGVTANYWDYATGSNSMPDGIDTPTDTEFDAIFQQLEAYELPNVITDVGVASPYGTYGQFGNIWEWSESAYVAPNNSPIENRVLRGSAWDVWAYLDSSNRNHNPPTFYDDSVGLRVASVPEPSATVLCMGGILFALARRVSLRCWPS